MRKLSIGACIVVTTIVALVLALVAACAAPEATATKTITITATPTTPAAPENIVWNLGAYVSEKGALGPVWIRLAQNMGERTNGRFTMNLHWSGALIGEEDALEGVKMGLVDMTLISSDVFTKELPLASLTNTPMLVPGATPEGLRAHMRPFLDAYQAHPLVQAELAQQNLEPVVSFFLGTAYVDVCGVKPIQSLNDLKGVKIRTTEAAAPLFQALGAVPVDVAYAEVYSALQTGVVQYSIHYGAYIAQQMYQEVADYLTLGIGLTQGSGLLVGLNRDSFNALPEDMKVLLTAEVKRALAEGYEAAVVQGAAAGEAKAREVFKNVNLLDPKVAAEIAKTAESLWKVEAEKRDAWGAPGTQMLDFILGLRAKLLGK